jgi:hypothetical protein
LPGAPRTDPYGRYSRIRLLPWMSGVKTHGGPRVKDFGRRNPRHANSRVTIPGDSVPVAASPKRTKPHSNYLSTEGFKTPDVARHRVVVEIAAYHTA